MDGPPDDVITLADFVEQQNDLEEDADAVLGGSDDQHCSYVKGYLPRQALYACRTCITSEEAAAGICLACSYHCHENHELIELYTKRSFRCDCGNYKFPEKCNLQPEKDLTDENRYNQNFKGLYCTCHRPYPDPDDSIMDEMIQCIICEDWYHGRHLESNVPDENKFSEMVCFGCMSKVPFLWKYSEFMVLNTKDKENSVVEVENVNKENGGSGEGSLKQTKIPEKDIPKKETENNIENKEMNGEKNSEQKEIISNGVEKKENFNDKTENKKVNGGESSKQEEIPENSSTKKCFLDGKIENIGKGSTFWCEGWRKNLCQCFNCLENYEKLQVKFLLDETDTVQYYEGINKSGETQLEKGMKALSSLGHVQQVEAIQGYNNMKTALKEYLQKFADNNKVVREEDIREFFTQMEARKRQRVEAPPHFCR